MAFKSFCNPASSCCTNLARFYVGFTNRGVGVPYPLRHLPCRDGLYPTRRLALAPLDLLREWQCRWYYYGPCHPSVVPSCIAQTCRMDPGATARLDMRVAAAQLGETVPTNASTGIPGLFLSTLSCLAPTCTPGSGSYRTRDSQECRLGCLPRSGHL